MTATTKAEACVTRLYGGLTAPACETIKVMLTDGHKVYGPGSQLLEPGEVLTLAVRVRPSLTGHGTTANLFLMAPGLPQLIGGCYVHGKARGRAKWVEYDGCRDVTAWVERFLREQHTHVIEMPAGFEVGRRPPNATRGLTRS